MLNQAKKKVLRKQAEAIAGKKFEQLTRLTPDEALSAAYEMQVYQIELELQNEELLHTQQTLEEARKKYFQLFHNAPIGYVVLDSAGMITQSNATFARMVQDEKESQQGRPFADFLEKEDVRLFRSRFKAFINKPEGKRLVVRLRNKNGTSPYVQLEAVPDRESDGALTGRLMITVTDIMHQIEVEHELKKALAYSQAQEKEITSLLKGASTVLKQDDFPTTARKIFDACRELIGAASGYVALLSESGEENEVLFLESGGLPCDVDPELPMPIRGLRSEAYAHNKTVYDNDFMNSSWVRFMPKGHVVLKNVMFSPLVLEGKTVGIIGLANKGTDFDENDAKLAAGFGKLAAVALQNSRNLDARDRAEKQKEAVIENLEEALAEVNNLSGLLPICSHCKKIRDDSGYWKQIEAYIEEHSEAQFSHGICQECARKYYPDLDIFEEE